MTPVQHHKWFKRIRNRSVRNAQYGARMMARRSAAGDDRGAFGWAEFGAQCLFVARQAERARLGQPVSLGWWQR